MRFNSIIRWAGVLVLIFAFFITSCNEEPEPYIPEASNPTLDDNQNDNQTPGDDNESEPDDNNEPSKEDPTLQENPHRELPINLPIPDLGDYNDYEYLTNCEIFDYINNLSWNYNLLLPPSYNINSEETYPILFLLHGYNSDRNAWVNSLNLRHIIDYYHETEGLPEIIVVMPDAENTYYYNNHQGSIKYEDYFFNLFIPELLREYRVQTLPKPLMIAGFSMGGYGASYYALKYSDLFGFCYAMSAPLDGNGRAARVPSLFEYFKYMEPDEMPVFIFDDGLNDYFIKANLEADFLLDYFKLPHECIIREGSHNIQFWTESLYIMFDRINKYLHSEL